MIAATQPPRRESPTERSMRRDPSHDEMPRIRTASTQPPPQLAPRPVVHQSVNGLNIRLAQGQAQGQWFQAAGPMAPVMASSGYQPVVPSLGYPPPTMPSQGY